MKKLFLSFAMVAAGSAAFAQIPAGTMMLGGSIGFGTSGGTTEVKNPAATITTDLPSSSSFTFSPTFGYFLSDNMAVGASVNFGTSSTTTKRAYDKTTGAVGAPSPTPGANEVAFDEVNKTSGFGISLFANMYNEINDKWLWYYGATLGFSNGGGTMTAVEETSPGVWSTKENDKPSTTTIGLGANLGVTYFLSDNWGLQAGLNNLLNVSYAMGSAETKIGTTTVTTSTNDLNLNVGTGSFGLGGVSIGVFYFLGK